jgi:hypothetical protein
MENWGWKTGPRFILFVKAVNVTGCFQQPDQDKNIADLLECADAIARWHCRDCNHSSNINLFILSLCTKLTAICIVEKTLFDCEIARING